jgi:hypothetical protein
VRRQIDDFIYPLFHPVQAIIRHSKQVLLHAEVRVPDPLSELIVSILRVACRTFSEDEYISLDPSPEKTLRFTQNKTCEFAP